MRQILNCKTANCPPLRRTENVHFRTHSAVSNLKSIEAVKVVVLESPAYIKSPYLEVTLSCAG